MLCSYGLFSLVLERNNQLRNQRKGRVLNEGAEHERGSWGQPDQSPLEPWTDGCAPHGPSTPEPSPKGPHPGPLTANPFILTLFILIMKHGFPSSKPKLGSSRPEQFCSMSVVNLQENLVWLGALKLSWINTLSEVQLMLSSWATGE